MGQICPMPISSKITYPTDHDSRASNVYFHLCQAKDAFTAIIIEGWHPIDPMPIINKLAGSIDVELDASPGEAKYQENPKKFTFYTGRPALDIHDPCLDSEVICHEYAHAVLHVVQPDIFDSDHPAYLFNKAINEGVAFFYGCTLSEPFLKDPTTGPRWGEFAYQGVWDKPRTLQREGTTSQKLTRTFWWCMGSFLTILLTLTRQPKRGDTPVVCFGRARCGMFAVCWGETRPTPLFCGP